MFTAIREDKEWVKCITEYSNELETSKRKDLKMNVYFEVYDILHEKTLTEKTSAILEIIQNDFDMSTKNVIKEIDKLWESKVTVSERQVQRVRKDIKVIKDIINGYFPSTNIEENVLQYTIYNNYLGKTFPSMTYKKFKKVYEAFKSYNENLNKLKGENMTGTNSMSAWQIDILNMANQGGWSLQQISEKLQLDADRVRNTLNSFHYMIKTDVLDEESNDVYFNANEQEVPDTEVVENSTTPIVVHKPYIPPVKEADFWEVEIDCVDACSKAKESINVFLSKKARSKAMKYMQWAKAREWLAYLIGEKVEDEYFIHDLHLPMQKTSATLVDQVVEQEYNNLGIVGVIHSHHEMGAGDENHPSFSGHDSAFINGNHNLSLLAGRDHITKGFKIVGIARTKTPCDSFITVKAVVKPMKEEMSDEEKSVHDEFMVKVLGKGKELTKVLKEDPFKGNTVLGNKVSNSGDGVIDTRKNGYHFNNKCDPVVQ